MPELKDRIFVSIAVSKPDGDLQALPGAIKASERMAAWADANGYIALLINDDLFPEVTTELLRTEISKTILEVTAQKTLRRIVIFFAGHGAALGIDDQYWMLSRWNKRPTEAVKISSLQRMLEYYGPEQVTIIGDACQEFSSRFIDVAGGPILDRSDEAPRHFELDRFFPVDAGSQAFMIKADGGQEAFCLFSEVMLDVLTGDAPEKYFEEIDGSRHVTSQSLATYLMDNLPVEAGKYGLHMNPRPSPGFYTDRVYYSAPKPGGQPAPSILPPPPVPVETSSADKFASSPRSWTAKPSQRSFVPKVKLTVNPTRGSQDNPAKALEVKRRATEMAYSAAANEEVRGHFETGCGICFTGAAVGQVLTSRGMLSQDYLPPNWYRLELSDQHDPLLWADVLVQLADGNIASACVVQNFITAVHSYESGGVNVLHRPLNASPDEGSDVIAMLGKMQAGSLTEEQIVDAAAQLRSGKHQILTRGAIVAQFYDSIRDTESLRSIAAFYAMRNQPIPLDVVLFGGGKLFAKGSGLVANIPATKARSPRSPAERDLSFTFEATFEVVQYPVAGRVPWMSQAWDAVQTADCDESAESWRKLALSVLPHLGAGPFSQVRSGGSDALFALAGVGNNGEFIVPGRAHQ